MQARTSSWRRLAQVLWGLLPSRPVSPAAQLADEVALRLRDGSALGPALRASFPLLSRLSVERACDRFEGGAVALLIVDVRDGLVSLVSSAAHELSQRDGWAPTAAQLQGLARALHGDTFVQHLINTCLEALGVYTESHAVEHAAVDAEALSRAVTKLLSRSLPAMVSRAELSRSMTKPDDYSGGVEQPA